MTSSPPEGIRVLLHDFSGHPFQAELSRELSERGHEVEHVFCEQYVSGKGRLAHQPDDSDRLRFTAVDAGREFDKYSPVNRLRFEVAYARAWLRQLHASAPEVVVACNLPLISQFLFSLYARFRRLPYVFWHQDIYSYGLAGELRRTLPRPLASLGGWLLERAEAFCARSACHVVAIGDAFRQVYGSWRVPEDGVSVIPNWAPLAEIHPVDGTSGLAEELFAESDDDDLKLLYAGTLGRKHNPDLVVELLRTAREQGVRVSLTVVSEGDAADDLAAQAERDPSLGLRVRGFQPAEALPEVLGAADVLVALLEPDATRFSIPSKVLSYMAAGRPILGLMPADNPASVDIVATGGFVAEPTTSGARTSVAWLESLQRDADRVTEIGRNAREVAEEKFDVNKVGNRFEEILTTVSG